MSRKPENNSLTIVDRSWEPTSLFEVFEVFTKLRKEMWAAGYDRFEIGPNAYCKGAYGIRAYPKVERSFKDGGPWPPVWRIVEKLGLGWGCGGGHGHQIYEHPFLNGWHYRQEDEVGHVYCNCGGMGQPRVHHGLPAGTHCDKCWQELLDDYNSRCW